MEIFETLITTLRSLVEPIPYLGDFAEYPYVFRALILVVALSLACAAIGVVVNLRCAEFQVEALVHSVFPGVVLGAWWGGVNSIIPGSFMAGILAAVAITWINSRERRESSESGTAVVLTTFFSIGLVLLLAMGDMSGQLEALMFGRLLEITDIRLAQALGCCAIGVVAAWLTWKEQVALAFDAVGARAVGMNTFILDLVMTIAVATVAVSGAAAVGILLVIGYIILPATSARLIGKNVRSVFLIAALIGLSSGVGGLSLLLRSTSHSISPQATIVLLMSGILVGTVAWARRSQKRKRWIGSSVNLGVRSI